MSGTEDRAAVPARPLPPWRGETYHDRPVVKASSFDWKVSTYILMLGLAGGAQVLAAMARLTGRGGEEEGLVRRARLLALGGATVGPLVLIQHLKTPQRWYNMLRIFRPTSPMSLGSWLLSAFGGLSALTALGALFGHRSRLARRVADAAQGPAAVAGAGMGVYTAALLSSTSTPLWAAAPGPLAAQFGAASMAGAASTLALAQRRAGEDDSARRLEMLAAAAVAGELAAALTVEHRLRRAGLAYPLEQGEAAALYRGGAKGVGVLLPLALQLLSVLGRRTRPGRAVAASVPEPVSSPRLLPELASIAMIVGGAAMRHAILVAGNESACRPRDAFRFAQPPAPRAGR